jgi:hypothetical protein
MDVHKMIQKLDDVESDSQPLYHAKETPTDDPAVVSTSAAQVNTVDKLDLDKVQKRVMLCTENVGTHTIKRDQHDLLHLRNNGHTHFHYTFHLFFNEKHYFFESTERKGAAIVLSQLADMKQIHKHIELLDLSIRIVFHIRHMKIRQVDMRVYALTDGEKIDDKSMLARTVFMDKNNQRHYLLNETECQVMWDNNKSLRHPMSFKCQKNTNSLSHSVLVEDSKLPSDCPYSAESGELRLPPTIQDDDEKRIQVNHCYRDWMQQQRRKKYLKKMQERKTRKQKLNNLWTSFLKIKK